MKYYSEVEGQPLEIEIYSDTNGLTHVQLPDGRDWKVDFQPVLGEDLFSLLIEGQSHEVHVEAGEAPQQYEVSLDGQLYNIKVETDRQHRLAKLAPRQTVQTGEVLIRAPMPGLVTIIAVEVGQTVEVGQRIAVLEAMKMENELKTPKAGTVKSLNVQPGQTVEQNKILAVIE